jgi:hypothetical protein
MEFRESFEIIFTLIGVVVAATLLLLSKPGNYGENWPRLTKIVCWLLIVVLTPLIVYNMIMAFLE